MSQHNRSDRKRTWSTDNACEMRTGVVLFLVAALAGCSSSDKPTAASKNGADGCPVNSGFAGDSACIAKTGQELLLHYGPSNYDDPNEVALYTLTPGEETSQCIFFKGPSTDVYYSKLHGRLRPGSHHLIARAMVDADLPTGLPPLPTPPTDCANVGMLGTADSIGVSTYKEWEFPSGAPENQGLVGMIPANRTIMLNGHFIDSTDHPTLAEAWVVYSPVDKSQVQKLAQPLAVVGGLGFQIAPGTHQTYSYSCPAPSQPVRLIDGVGHFHAHGLHLSAIKVDGVTGAKTPILDQFDWETLETYNFDSTTTNPVANPTTKTDGAFSGLLTLRPGDSINWSCEVNNTGSVTLRFENEVQTGEMCIFVGPIVADSGSTASPYSCSRN